MNPRKNFTLFKAANGIRASDKASKPQTKTPINSRKPRTHKRTKQNVYSESMRLSI